MLIAAWLTCLHHCWLYTLNPSLSLTLESRKYLFSLGISQHVSLLVLPASSPASAWPLPWSTSEPQNPTHLNRILIMLAFIHKKSLSLLSARGLSQLACFHLTMQSSDRVHSLCKLSVFSLLGVIFLFVISVPLCVLEENGLTWFCLFILLENHVLFTALGGLSTIQFGGFNYSMINKKIV